METLINTTQQGKSHKYCTNIDIANQVWDEDGSTADFDYDETRGQMS